MTRTLRFTAVLTLSSLLPAQFVFASGLPHKARVQQATGPIQNAPVPPQITAAHRIFLSNNGADANFPGTAEEAYNAVFNALKSWGHYELVSSPDQADLLFKLRDLAPVTGVGGGDDVPAYAITSPAFQLTISDAHTRAHLWTVTSPVNLSYKRRERARWYQLSVTNLISRMKVVVGEPLTPTETADLTTVPKHSKTPYILMGGLLAAGVGGGLLLKHEYDQSVADQNAKLCQQNPFFCSTTAVRRP